MDSEILEWAQAREAVLARVVRLLIDNLKVARSADEIDPDTPLFGTGLGLDSIDAVELVVGFEQEFGIKLADDGPLATKLRTVNGLVDIALAAQERS